MKSKKTESNHGNFNNFVSRKSYENFSSVEWGRKGHVTVRTCRLSNKDLIIRNRFDFGNDSCTLMKNTKERKFRIPNLFNLYKDSEFDDNDN